MADRVLQHAQRGGRCTRSPPPGPATWIQLKTPDMADGVVIEAARPIAPPGWAFFIGRQCTDHVATATCKWARHRPGAGAAGMGVDERPQRDGPRLLGTRRAPNT